METALVVKMSAYYFAAFCLILLAVSNGKVIDDPIQDDGITDLGERYRRDGASLKGLSKCNDWSGWINRNDPGNQTNEAESVTQNELDTFCPLGGNVTLLKCKDIKGESIKNITNTTSGDKTYTYSCMKPIDGALCYLIDGNASCPDYFISFYCTCPQLTYSLETSVGPDLKTTADLTTTTVTRTTKSSTKSSTTSTKLTTMSTPLSSTSADSTTDSATTHMHVQPPTTNATKQTSSSRGTDGGANNSTGDDGKSNSLSGGSNNNTIGNSNVPWWLIPVLVAVVLFIINVIIAICLHKKVHKRIDQTVHPL